MQKTTGVDWAVIAVLPYGDEHPNLRFLGEAESIARTATELLRSRRRQGSIHLHLISSRASDLNVSSETRHDSTYAVSGTIERIRKSIADDKIPWHRAIVVLNFSGPRVHRELRARKIAGTHIPIVSFASDTSLLREYRLMAHIPHVVGFGDVSKWGWIKRRLEQRVLFSRKISWLGHLQQGESEVERNAHLHAVLVSAFQAPNTARRKQRKVLQSAWQELSLSRTHRNMAA